ncbi:MAG: acyl-CoA dehydrogenase family protein, partial [Acidimicrobiales bacterium]
MSIVTSTTTGADLLAAVERIRPVIEEHAPQGEADRRLAPAIYDAFKQAGLLRMWIPAASGGLELHPADACKVFTAVSAIDGAAGWNLNQHSAVPTLASWCRGALDWLFADPDAYWAGVFWPPAAATAVDGGYRISGRVGFASGCEHAVRFIAAAIVMADGAPVLDAETGQPDFLAVAYDMSQLTVLDTWRTLGMRATGSHDVTIEDDVFVPHERVAHVFKLSAERPAPIAGPLYGMAPWTGLLAHAAVPLGIAGTALDRAVRLAATKVPNFLQVTLRDKHVVQMQLAQARAQVEAAAAYLDRAAHLAYDSSAAGRFTPEEKVSVQLACNFTAAAAAKAISLVHQVVGASAVR